MRYSETYDNQNITNSQQKCCSKHVMITFTFNMSEPVAL